MVYKRRRPIGGKVEVKYLNKLLNESYKNKGKTNTNIDDRYILDKWDWKARFTLSNSGYLAK